MTLALSLFENQIEELSHLGEDGSAVYLDRFQQLNVEVFRQCESLLPRKGKSVEEEAALCYLLLRGYGAIVCSGRGHERKMQRLLDRAAEVVDRLPEGSVWRKKLLGENAILSL